MRSYGINEKVLDELHAHGILHQKVDKATLTVDYSDSAEFIGGFQIKATWFNTLGIDRYIQLLMHQFFLGLATGNFKLILEWAKDNWVK